MPHLTPDLIRRIKRAALAAAPPDLAVGIGVLRERVEASRLRAGRASGFGHPGAGYAGAAELAVLRARLTGGNESLQAAATQVLITVSRLRALCHRSLRFVAAIAAEAVPSAPSKCMTADEQGMRWRRPLRCRAPHSPIMCDLYR